MHCDLGFRASPTSLVAYDKSTLQRVGSVEFALFDGACYIDNMETVAVIRRQGVATKLVHELIKEVGVPYQKLRWAIRSDEGVALKRALDEQFRKELP